MNKLANGRRGWHAAPGIDDAVYTIERVQIHSATSVGDEAKVCYNTNLLLKIQFICSSNHALRWLGSRVVSVLDSGAEGPGFKSQSRRCRVTVLGKMFTPIVPLFTKQQNW